MDGIDGGLLLVRVFIGALMLAHGTQQLFGWFHGYGITGSGQFLESLGYRHGRAMAIVTGLVEAGGGGLLALGAGTAPAVAGLIGLSLNIAVAGHGRNGFWNHNVPPGWEYPAALAVVFASFAFTGPGAYSLDAALDLPAGSLPFRLAGLLLGVGVGVVTLAIRRRPAPAMDAERTDDAPEAARDAA